MPHLLSLACAWSRDPGRGSSPLSHDLGPNVTWLFTCLRDCALRSCSGRSEESLHFCVSLVLFLESCSVTMDLNLEAEVICFCKPCECTLFVAGFPSALCSENRWHFLHTVFSQFGLVHQIRQPTSETQPYAFVTFYSSFSAARAKACLHKVLCVDNKILKVSILSQDSWPLQELFKKSHRQNQQN